jgi:uncharacterized membrane protein
VALARHARLVDQRLRVIRISTVSVIWLCGLGAGFVALLAAAAKYGCAASNDGFGCGASGEVVGVVLVITVIAVVILVTLMTHDRPARRVLTVGGFGLAALVLCFVAAHAVLATT